MTNVNTVTAVYMEGAWNTHVSCESRKPEEGPSLQKQTQDKSDRVLQALYFRFYDFLLFLNDC